MRAGGRAAGRSVAALLVLALVAGCSGGSDAPPPTTATTTTRPPGEIVEGGVLRMGLAGPVHPDPATANLGSPSDMLVLDLLHDGLTRVAEDGTIAPALALEWTPDATFTTWVFKLDPAATFTSGRPVTSADVLVSLDRIAKGGNSSLAALRLETIAGFGNFVAGTADHLSGVTAPDAATVQITLDAPMSLLPTVLASPVYGLVDSVSLAAATGESGDLAHLDLSGDWEITAAKGPVVDLERRTAAAGHLDGVQLRAYSDGEGAYGAFDDGKVDWALVPADHYDAALADHGDDAFTPFQAELFFGLRVTAPALADVRMRQAIAAAIDRWAIVRAVYPDLADPLTSVVPVGVPGHDAQRCAACVHDVAKARALVAAVHPDGVVPTVAIDYDQSPPQEEMARLIAGDLKDAGIPTQLRPKPLAEYKSFVVTGAQELFSFGWIGVYGSPDAYLAPLFGSAANDNLTGFASPGADLELVAARSTSDPAAALAHWATVEAQVLGEAVVVPIAQFRTQTVLGERVRAFQAAVDGSVDWSAVWLADGA